MGALLGILCVKPGVLPDSRSFLTQTPQKNTQTDALQAQRIVLLLIGYCAMIDTLPVSFVEKPPETLVNRDTKWSENCKKVSYILRKFLTFSYRHTKIYDNTKRYDVR